MKKCMRRVAVLVGVAALLFPLSGCGGSSNNPPNNWDVMNWDQGTWQ